MANLKVVQNEAGDYFYGFDVGDDFITVGGVSAAHVAQQVERAASLNERLANDDQAAKDAIELRPISSKATTTKDDDKGGKS